VQDGWERRTLDEVNLTGFWIGREVKRPPFFLWFWIAETKVFSGLQKHTRGRKKGKAWGFFPYAQRLWKRNENEVRLRLF